MHPAYRGPALDLSPVKLRPSSSSSALSASMRGEREAGRAADLPRAVWSPFNVRSEIWGSGSLLSIAREHHAAVGRIDSHLRAQTSAGSRRRVAARASPPRRVTMTPARMHGQMTHARLLQQWPRGALPMDPLRRDSSFEALSPRLSPRRPKSGLSPSSSTSSLELYARELRPANYRYGPPGQSRAASVTSAYSLG